MRSSSELIREGYRRARMAARHYFPKTVTFTVADVGIKGSILDHYGLLCGAINCFVDVRSTWADDKPRAFCYKHRRYEHAGS